jgi:hypothetical protein
MFSKKFLLSYVLLFCTLPTLSHAETDATLMASGQWRDPKTGLIWMRCLVGQKWTGKTCSGDAKNVSPSDSFKMIGLFNQSGGFAGKNNWRLPTVEELSALRQCNTWSYSEVQRQELTYDGYKTVSIKTPTIINIPSTKGTKEIPKSCSDSIASMDTQEPESWQINTKIFQGLLVHNFMDRTFPASSQPKQIQITPNLPLWSVGLALNVGTAKAPNYATSSQQALFAVRSE